MYSKIKTRIINYLSITKKEWNGMVVLVILIMLVTAAPNLYQLFHKDGITDFKDFNKAVAQLSRSQYRGNPSSFPQLSDDKIQAPVLFPFNPNNLSIKQWQQFGLSSRQAAIIKHYEAKGGTFHIKDDVKKMYSITADDYKRLEPYISLPEAGINSKKAKASVIIELNTVDTAKLTELKGIGPSFADRIISYRNRLGGFLRKEQLLEVYGFDSTKYAEIKGQVSVDPSRIKKISINTISINQLRIFPYLNYKQANAVIEYRAQHGKYNSIADLKNVVLLDDQLLNRIKPYFEF